MTRRLIIGVARILDWDMPKPKIACNDVIRNFSKEEILVARRYRRMELQKPWPVCWHLTKILLKGEEFESKVKK